MTSPARAPADLQKQALLKIRELRAELAELRRGHAETDAENIAGAEPIAVVGMDCRFPGGSNSPAAYWEFLNSGRDPIAEIPSDRWDVARYFDPDPSRPGKSYVKEGGFLDQIDQFDADFFGISQREANNMDPQQRLFLEVAWHALEDAGIPPRQTSGSSTGVFLGICSQDYARFNLQSGDVRDINAYSFTGNAGSIAAGRLSYLLGLQGPSIAIDTACSSSLVAVHLACQSLRAGEVRTAVVGAVSVILQPENYVYFCGVGALSPSARCYTFDSRANGYVRSEGCGVVVLKRLSNALADKDPIHAVVRASAVNQDGRSYGLTAPNGSAQRELLKEALRRAGVDARQVAYVEAHGTGTPLGDPVEVAALADVLGAARSPDDPLIIGSAKSNFGHLEAAAGMAGLMKTALALRHGTIPPNLHFQSGNPQIDWSQGRLKVATEALRWPDRAGPRLAGVSAFGFSGTNAHLLLGEAPPLPYQPAQIARTIFNRRRCWVKSQAGGRRALLDGPAPVTERNGASNGVGARPSHPLLGDRLYSPALSAICFQATVRLDEVDYLRGHPVWGRIVLPGSGYVDLVTTAVRRTFADRLFAIRDILYQEPFVLREDGPERLQVTLEQTSDRELTFQVLSMVEPDQPAASAWRTHATGRVVLDQSFPSLPPFDPDERRFYCQQQLDGRAFYARLSRAGYLYGADHQGVRQAWLGEGEIVAEIDYPQSLLDKIGAERLRGDDTYSFHPALLDSCFQPLLALLPKVDPGAMFITLGKGAVRCGCRPEGPLWVAIKRRPPSAGGAATITADIEVYDRQGRVVATVDGYSMIRTANHSSRDATNGEPDAPPATRNLYELAWHEVAVPETGRDRRLWLVFDEDAGALTAQLRRAGVRCWQVRRGTATERASDDTFTLDPDAADGYGELVRAATGPGPGGLPAAGILYGWSMAAAVPATPGAPLARPLGLESLLRATRAATEVAGPANVRLVVLTRGAYPVGPRPHPVDPAQTAMWGFAQSIRAERPELDVRCVDLDPDPAASAAEWVVPAVDVGAAPFVACRQGKQYQPALAPAPATGVSRLVIHRRGDLATLAWQAAAAPPLEPDEIAIRVRATGLNFRDVVDGLGLHPRPMDQFGLEGAGIVTRCGADVTALAPGDEVVAVGTGAFGDEWITKAALAVRKPSGLSFEEAATIPIAFLTARLALDQAGGLAAGQRILIHAAAGGVGMAAVQLSRLAGAEVFATASPAKWPLLRSLGVARTMSSRTLDFGREVLAATDGDGVDLVVNSLAGETVATSLAALTTGGHFVEIGIKGWTPAEVRQVRPDVRFSFVNLMARWESDPASVHALLAELMGAVAQGKLAPLPHRLFAADRVVDAFRFMQQGKHVGKIVVPRPPAPAERRPPALAGTYLITGGLGSVGLRTARVLVRRGVKALALMGRTEPGPGARDTIAALNAAGAEVRFLPGDVADPAHVAAVLETIRARMPPLKGIVHAAGVTADGRLEDLSTEAIERVLRPKVAGAINLDRLTRGDDLETFWLFSSLAALVGAAGAANYASANAFLDGLAHRRRAEGLPATSIGWGPWQGAGMFEALAESARRQTVRQGIKPLAAEDQEALLGELLTRPPAGHYGAFAVDWPTWAAHHRHQAGGAPPFTHRLSRSARRRGGEGEQRAGNPAPPTLQAELVQSSPATRRKRLVALVCEQVAELLELGAEARVDPAAGFFEIGLDSLTSVELRNRLQSALGINVPAAAVFDYPNAVALADFLRADLEALAGAQPPGEAPDEPSRSDAAPPAGGELAALASLPAPQRRARLVASLREELARVLDVEDAARIPTDCGFFELGLDSLTSVELRNRLQARLGCPVQAAATFDYPTVGALADHLLADMPASEQPGASWPAGGTAVAEPVGNEPARDLSALLDDLDQLTDAEARRRFGS